MLYIIYKRPYTHNIYHMPETLYNVPYTICPILKSMYSILIYHAPHTPYCKPYTMYHIRIPMFMWSLRPEFKEPPLHCLDLRWLYLALGASRGSLQRVCIHIYIYVHVRKNVKEDVSAYIHIHRSFHVFTLYRVRLFVRLCISIYTYCTCPRTLCGIK